MKTRYVFLWKITGVIISVFLAIIMACCSEKDSPEEIREEAKLQILSGNLSNSVIQEGGVVEITFQTNYDWTAVVDDASKGWITVTPASGTSGKSTVSISVKENTGNNPRVGNVVLSCGDAEKTIEIKQDGNIPIIRLEQDKFLVSGNNGGTVELKLMTNVEYSMVMPDEEWVKETASRGYTTDSYIIEIEPNDSEEPRLCVVKFINEDEGLSCSAVIQQTAAGDKLADVSLIEMDSDGGSVEVALAYDYEYDISVSDADWIHLGGLTGNISKFTVNIDENDGKSARTAVISVAGGNVTYEIRVEQSSKLNVDDSGIDDMPVEEWK